VYNILRKVREYGLNTARLLNYALYHSAVCVLHHTCKIHFVVTVNRTIALMNISL